MSSYFIWDAQLFELGISNLDQEHQKLISLMNLIYEKNQSATPKEELLKIMTEFIDFVLLHFHHEESHMEKIKFSDLHNHRSIHHRLLSQLKQHHQDFESGSSEKINESFFDFLALWLTTHIQHFDRKYT